MAEIMLQSKVVNQEWRDCLLNNKVDIFEFIKKMIKMAANDRPSEFIVKRSNLLDTLYSCEVAASSKLEKQDAPTSTPRPSLKIRIKLKKPNLLAKAPATPPPPQQKLQNRVLQKISIQSLNNIPKPTSQKVEFQPRDSDMEKKLDLSKRKLQMRYNEVECMKQKRKDDDSYILPVLLRFDGQPQVDEEGNILYRFPSLQRTAAQTSGRKEYVGRRFSEWVGGVDKFFKENKWDFRNMTVSPSGFISFVSEIFPLLHNSVTKVARTSVHSALTDLSMQILKL